MLSRLNRRRLSFGEHQSYIQCLTLFGWACLESKSISGSGIEAFLCSKPKISTSWRVFLLYHQ